MGGGSFCVTRFTTARDRVGNVFQFSGPTPAADHRALAQSSSIRETVAAAPYIGLMTCY